jgi:hypothetical protein
MADSVYIEGLGSGLPVWSTETTQQQLLKVMQTGMNKNTQANTQMLAVLQKIVNGDKSTSAQLSAAVSQLAQANSVATKTHKEAKSTGKTEEHQLSFLTRMLTGTNKLVAATERGNRIQEQIKKLTSKGVSPDAARIEAEFGEGKSDIEKMKKIAEDGAGFVKKLLIAGKGLNEAVKQGGMDRFNLSQEMRQSGMFAGMDTFSAGMTNIAKTITAANFTFGEAQRFTQQFSQSVGIRGVKASMEFANSMASSGEGMGDMMNNFGMEFREVSDIAGTYLDSVRSLGQLDKISNADLRSGMDSFMSTVVSTSNIMKINLQDAAEMIRDTLKQDKFASMLSTLDKTTADAVKNMVGQFGGQDSPFAQALATRLAAGSAGAFAQTAEFTNINSDALTAQFLPMIEQIASASSGGPEAMQAALASMGPSLEAMVQFGKTNSSLILSDVGNAQASQAAAMEMLQTLKNADAGRIGITSEDQAMNQTIEVARQRDKELENIGNMTLAAIDLTKYTSQLNESSLQLTKAMGDAGAAFSGVVGKAAETSMDIESKIIDSVAFAINTATAAKKLTMAEGEFESIRGNTTAIDNLTAAINRTQGKFNKTAGVQPEFSKLTRNKQNQQISDMGVEELASLAEENKEFSNSLYAILNELKKDRRRENFTGADEEELAPFNSLISKIDSLIKNLNKN